MTAFTTSRRSALLGLAGLATWPMRAIAQSPKTELSKEEQRGDVVSPYESLLVDRAFAESLTDAGRARFEARAAEFPSLMSHTAQQFVGHSRINASDSIGNMLRLFELPFQYKSGKFVPFCASGLAYVAALTYVRYWKKRDVSLAPLRSALAEIDHYHFFPSPSVWHMYEVAQGKGRWIAKSPEVVPSPGWVVVFDFGKGADHVGLVLSGAKQHITTFECNTSGFADGSQQNGGVIAIKNRGLEHVKGYIRTDLARAV